MSKGDDHETRRPRVGGFNTVRDRPSAARDDEIWGGSSNPLRTEGGPENSNPPTYLQKRAVGPSKDLRSHPYPALERGRVIPANGLEEGEGSTKKPLAPVNPSRILRQEDYLSLLGEQVDVLYTSTHSKNITVNLEFDVVNDLEDELEQFNYLVRRGDFANAISFFNQYLAAHKSNPWIFVQHAEMLLEMGDYKSLHKLDPGQMFVRHGEHSESLEILNLNWDLLKTLALCHTQFEREPVVELLCLPHQILPVPDDIGSTELRNLCLTMRVLRITGQRGLDERFPFNLNDWANWGMIYRNLLAQGRLWDFGDLLIALWDLVGPIEAQYHLFGSRNILNVIETDWQVTEPDESRLLALLDILTQILLSSEYNKGVFLFDEGCLLVAGDVGKSLMQEFPQTVKSRPFLQWILVQSSLATRRGNDDTMGFSYFSDYAGIALFPTRLGLPMYIPLLQENPGWSPPVMAAESFLPLQIVLRASKENRDYLIEELCLVELLVRQADPTSTINDLTRLQKEVQDMLGYSRACITRYLIAQDGDSRANLLKDLEELGYLEDPSNLIHPLEACARDIIQQALSPSPETLKRNNMVAAVRYYNWLPQFMQNRIRNYVNISEVKRPTPKSQGRPPDTKKKSPEKSPARDKSPEQSYVVRHRSSSLSPVVDRRRWKEKEHTVGTTEKTTPKSHEDWSRPKTRPPDETSFMPTIEEVFDPGDDDAGETYEDEWSDVDD